MRNSKKLLTSLISAAFVSASAIAWADNEVNDDMATANPYSATASFPGVIGDAMSMANTKDVDFYRITTTAGQTVSISVVDDIDLRIYVWRPDGAPAQMIDGTPDLSDPTMPAEISAGGDYVVAVIQGNRTLDATTGATQDPTCPSTTTTTSTTGGMTFTMPSLCISTPTAGGNYTMNITVVDPAPTGALTPSGKTINANVNAAQGQATAAAARSKPKK